MQCQLNEGLDLHSEISGQWQGIGPKATFKWNLKVLSRKVGTRSKWRFKIRWRNVFRDKVINIEMKENELNESRMSAVNRSKWLISFSIGY